MVFGIHHRGNPKTETKDPRKGLHEGITWQPARNPHVGYAARSCRTLDDWMIKHGPRKTWTWGIIGPSHLVVNNPGIPRVVSPLSSLPHQWITYCYR